MTDNKCTNCRNLQREIYEHKKYIEFLEHDRRNWFRLCQSLSQVIIKSEVDPVFIYDEADHRAGNPPIEQHTQGVNTMRVSRLGGIGGLQVVTLDCFGNEMPEQYKEFHRVEIGLGLREGLIRHVINGRLKDGFE